MDTLNKLETIKLLQSGHILIQKKYPYFGTKSLFKPIKKFNKFTSQFWINDKMVNPNSGYSIIKNNVKYIKIYKQGLVETTEWEIK
jgi:hypothetical protein